jgi:hypothetical protein
MFGTPDQMELQNLISEVVAEGERLDAINYATDVVTLIVGAALLVLALYASHQWGRSAALRRR